MRNEKIPIKRVQSEACFNYAEREVFGRSQMSNKRINF